MIKYMIMSYIVGFTGNKIFNKKDKSIKNSIKWGCISGSILIIIYVIFFKL
ncbi:hypothetical protein [Clostridium botulinum]|uniref:hypothetical protein n=1 Tax=Clostridium botulinum TaxID=1491 RepID=UPI001C9AB583|nr:hypothetical protein [Clostridium botulinum]MBY6898096.1 hypothetical protein [Clostridium botulinum]MBY6913277.1 hypothetical protein [Clostridium botulinum]